MPAAQGGSITEQLMCIFSHECDNPVRLCETLTACPSPRWCGRESARQAHGAGRRQVSCQKCYITISMMQQHQLRRLRTGLSDILRRDQHSLTLHCSVASQVKRIRQAVYVLTAPHHRHITHNQLGRRQYQCRPASAQASQCLSRYRLCNVVNTKTTCREDAKTLRAKKFAAPEPATADDDDEEQSGT